MASDFPAFVASGHDEYLVTDFVIASGNAGKAGSFCVLNTGTNQIDECGADPALILGLMTGPYAARTIYANGRMPVIILTDRVLIGLCSATTPTDAHLTRDYGIVKLASGNWALDISETVNTRMHVVRYDATAGIFFCLALPANLQGDSVVS